MAAAQQMMSTKKDYGSARAYAQEVHKWSQSVRCWTAYQQMVASAWSSFQMRQQQAALTTAHMAAYQQQQQQQMHQLGQPRPGAVTVRLNLARIFRSAGAAPGTPQTVVVRQCTVPSFVRRIAAEAIDAVILFFFKLMLVYLLVETDVIELEQFDRILSSEADLQTLIDVTQGLFNIELLCKLFAAVVEALCITFGGSLHAFPPGCTPGKWLLGLQVISCLDVQPVPGSLDRVAVTGLPAINLRSSFLRSVLKNMLTTFLFPLSTAFYMFNYNRAIYDLVAKTIVVSID